MSDRYAETNGLPDPTANWLHPFGNTFLRLSKNAVIRQVIGPLDIPDHRHGQPVIGLSWQDFVADFSAEEAQTGLLTLWEAVAHGKVAPDHCPATVPFKRGVVAQLHAMQHDSEEKYALHLASTKRCNLDTVIGTHTLSASNNLLQLSESILRGVYGPLTDAQVKTVGNIVTLAETLDRFFNDLRIEFTAPATQAPLPYTLDAILSFDMHEFSTIRRITTHRLDLSVDLPRGIRVYCYNTMRTVFKRLLSTLFENLSARTHIHISTATQNSNDTIRATISYHTTKPELLATNKTVPIDLLAAERFQAASTLQQLLTRTQAHLSPVNGRVWAEPVTDDNAHTMRICADLPRWRD